MPMRQGFRACRLHAGKGCNTVGIIQVRDRGICHCDVGLRDLVYHQQPHNITSSGFGVLKDSSLPEYPFAAVNIFPADVRICKEFACCQEGKYNHKGTRGGPEPEFPG